MVCMTECASPRMVTVRARSASDSSSSARNILVQPSSHTSSSALRVVGGSTNSLSRSRFGFSPSTVRKSVQRDRIFPDMCFTMIAIEFASSSSTAKSCSSATCSIARSASFLYCRNSDRESSRYDVVNCNAMRLVYSRTKGDSSKSATLHIAYTYIGGFGGYVVFVEVLLDDLCQRSLGGKDEVDGVASCSLSAGVWGDVVGGVLDLLAGVGGGDGETALAHDGEVDDVVAYVGELVDGVAGFREDVADGVHLVGLALVDELELEVAGTDGYGLRVALGDDADSQASEATERDAEAVVGSEALGLDSLPVWAGDDEDLAVGEDAIYVEDEDFDVFCEVFCSHGLIIA